MGHPLTLVGFMEMYATQDACRRALFEQRWREGFPVRAALTRWPGRVARLRAVQGRGRGYQASLTAGALLHKTRTDLRKWLLAIWLLRRKITQAMCRGDAHLRLIDDAGAKTPTKAAGAQISPGGAVKSDDCSAYRAPPGAAYLPRAARRARVAGRRRAAALRAHRHPPTSSAGNSTSSMASAPRTCSPTATSYATGSGRRDARLDLFRRILNRCVPYTLPATYSQLIAA
jgi:hypothetical protein